MLTSLAIPCGRFTKVRIRATARTIPLFSNFMGGTFCWLRRIRDLPDVQLIRALFARLALTNRRLPPPVPVKLERFGEKDEGCAAFSRMRRGNAVSKITPGIASSPFSYSGLDC